MLSDLWRLISGKLQTSAPTVQDDDELSWLNPPANPLDVAAWDQFWINHVTHGIGPPFFDMFCDDSQLLRVMNLEGMKTILCAGNGISQEPKALAAAGMDVVALEISRQAHEIAEGYPFPTAALSQYYETQLQRPGGSVEFVTGNILDPEVCPGPFDVIIERLTAQNYYRHDLNTFLTMLSQRLSENGIFLSHSHDGGWRPPAKRRHFTESWFQAGGWIIWDGHSGRKPAGRVAWLETSTG